jgi:hypothetical protein
LPPIYPQITPKNFPVFSRSQGKFMDTPACEKSGESEISGFQISTSYGPYQSLKIFFQIRISIWLIFQWSAVYKKASAKNIPSHRPTG